MDETSGIKTNSYTVCYLFDRSLTSVLLVKKAGTDFAGGLNGCGGVIELYETPYKSALREILEETGFGPDDLVPVAGNSCVLLWLGDLLLPHDCKTGDGLCSLHMYAGIVSPRSEGRKRPETDSGEPVVWESVGSVLSAPFADSRYAGEGDVQYFVKRGLDTLRGAVTDNYEKAKENVK